MWREREGGWLIKGCVVWLSCPQAGNHHPPTHPPTHPSNPTSGLDSTEIRSKPKGLASFFPKNRPNNPLIMPPPAPLSLASSPSSRACRREEEEEEEEEGGRRTKAEAGYRTSRRRRRRERGFILAVWVGWVGGMGQVVEFGDLGGEA